MARRDAASHAADDADPYAAPDPATASSSTTVFPLTGSRRSGATAASGSSTNRRSRNRGCGTTSPGSSTTTLPTRIKSRSSVRGALTYGRSRPRSCSIASSASRMARAARVVSPTSDGVQAHRLRSRGADRNGVVVAGGGDVGQKTAKGRYRVVEMGAPIAHVAAEGDRYSIHREGSTSPWDGPTCSPRRPSRSWRPASA